MRKLLKHDIKDSYFEIVLFNLILIALSFVAFAFIKAQIYTFLTTVSILWMGVFYAVLFVVLRSVISIHTKLFTNVGYLTLTTPVSIDKILLSKIIVNMLWLFVTLIAVILSFLIVIQSFLSSTLSWSFFEFVWKAMKRNPWVTVKFIAYLLAYILNFIMILLFVLVFINTVTVRLKHKRLVGILVYIVFMSVVSQIASLISNIDILFVLCLGFCAGLYFLSRYLIVNKLELE